MNTLTIKCKACGHIHQWVQNPIDKPVCPKCGHNEAILIN